MGTSIVREEPGQKRDNAVEPVSLFGRICRIRCQPSAQFVGVQHLNPDSLLQEQDWFYDVITFLAELLTDNGVNVLIAATASRRAYRQAARARIGRFAEVYVHCSPEVCRMRDPKGLWKRAGKGQITGLPGLGTAYEPPESPEVRVDTGHLSIEAAAHQILRQFDEQSFFF